MNLPLHAVDQPDAGDRQHLVTSTWSPATFITGNYKILSFLRSQQGSLNLLYSVLFTHEPTWDDCFQLLQVLFTTEERDRIRTEA